MAFICGCWKTFSFEYMTQVSTTSCTCNFSPHSIWVWVKIYGPRKTLIKSWPATTRIKFGCGSVERSPASCTVIDSLLKELVIFSCARILCAFLPQNPKLLGREHGPPLLLRLLIRPRCSHGYNYPATKAPLAAVQRPSKPSSGYNACDGFWR